MKLDNLLEAVLFACGDPVPVERLCALLGADESEIEDAAARLTDQYAFEERGMRVIRLEKSYQMVTAPEAYETVRLALETRRPPRLTQAALEVLAIVAYFQPVTRTYIEQVRGVDSSYTVGVLADRGLIEPCGRLDVPGRPMQFKTTDTFLRSFGLKSLEDLPEIGESRPDDEQLSIESAIEALTQQAEAPAEGEAPPEGDAP
ncbi:MAG: SMC-Scp complex subunit ScpB [Oscillospiraceae bacterium]|nr:SMC-Scp complex subunit ScpB [Oscillospiraceae bacterium]